MSNEEMENRHRSITGLTAIIAVGIMIALPAILTAVS